MSKKKTPQQIAEEQVAVEEAERREVRIAEIAAEEQRKQDEAEAERKAVEARRKAAAEAEKLVEERKPAEDALQAKIEELSPLIEELADLHDRHRKTLGESLDPEYNKRHHEGYERIGVNFLPGWAGSNNDVRNTIRSFLEGSLPILYRDAKAPKGTLAEADPLTPVEADDQAGRPVGDFPWDRLEQTRQEIFEKDAAERERRRALDAARKLGDLRRRHERVRRDYGRPVSFYELVAPEERAQLRELCTEEEIEAFRAEIEAETSRKANVSPDMVSGGEPGKGAA